MSTPFYVTFQTPAELEEKALKLLREAKESGKIRKGTNETTKAIERGLAKLVYIALDVQPPEVVAHLPLLCEDKKVPYIFISEKKKIGEAAGLEVSAAAACIIEVQNKELLAEIINSISSLKQQKK
ncbi:50S ribosomal protein L7ae [Candidatus Marsarchaeota G2 archaeon ECH_B_SAG-F08]|jgi:large subunit ribosomal protein L7Ae|uniref:Large ribosomal subunit protein eL8 n=4 Tax=Candidatus Marsarchaeota TaxID=1978152 RepID=A0A2R6AK39_9ARCH|nr:MAG: 50S ribosomal protein L7ae [Candidatus Marsarchaeota G1 archaeon BE_D]PSN88854.1 MAG: 50S ribosomal protein L7ae [Candidatus Marsarchaeota G1 archaeon OSP_C]PSN95646.1 MAG: 50S ribosomal protein L7ae [Candidatus Marsarchaeota G1 archaeon OSP_B]PSN97884.1 MAG: 50S ribosomal protein L7ae [Candidatus Marsarchaeota G2 archaeon ECH_B_SAG-F08]